MADEAYPVGSAPARESYLNQARILEVIQQSGAEALHPGYGFLAENGDFAEAVTESGCCFVGPSAAAIRAMGSKIESKRIVAEAGISIVPGYQGDDQSPAVLQQKARETEYPVLIKASAGGGGRGMRLVETDAEFEMALHSAKREAKSAFGDDLVLIEKYLTSPRHIEVQILADDSGETRYLFERDCSIQRRHQKVVEEAPAPGIGQKFRQQIGEAAVKVASAIRYQGAGTVEFIVQDDQFYFMEMNTRLQVEHPVTEVICNIDLVEWQLRVAAGELLPWRQEELTSHGHAIEARVYAENPRKKFLPSTGILDRAEFPENVRIDTGVATGDEVSMHYDPMIAKVIAWGQNRESALTRLIEALEQCRIAGPEHNLNFLVKVLQQAEFREGRYTTGFIDRHMSRLTDEPGPLATVQAALWLTCCRTDGDHWHATDNFRLNAPHRQRLTLEYQKQPRQIEVEYRGGGCRVKLDDRCFDIKEISRDGNSLFALIDHTPRTVEILEIQNLIYVMQRGRTERVVLVRDEAVRFDEHGASSQGRILAPMPGQVIAIPVGKGEQVKQGQALMVIEAMKMEHTIVATHAGRVSAINYLIGDRVEDGAELVIIGQNQGD